MGKKRKEKGKNGKEKSRKRKRKRKIWGFAFLRKRKSLFCGIWVFEKENGKEQEVFFGVATGELV